MVVPLCRARELGYARSAMLRRALPALFAAGLAIACTMHASDVAACGTAYPKGNFIHVQAEQTLVVWDEKTKTEHFVRKPRFDGDPESFGFFVPTPVVPQVGKADPKLFERVRDLVEPPPPMMNQGVATGMDARGSGRPGGAVDVLQTVKVDDYELVSLKASDEQALGDWLGKHGFTDRPSLRDWAKNYVERGWIINAMRYAGTKEKAKTSIETPTLRLSFAIEEPFYPYSEPPDDPSDLRAFQIKRGYVPQRTLDVWLVSRKSMFAPEAVQAWGGLQIRTSTRVGATLLAEALGDTKDWGFATSAEDSWVVTHLADAANQRAGMSDLVFTSYSIPPPAIGRGMPGYAAPKADVTPAAAIEKAKDDKKKPHRWRKLALAGLALALALGVLYALRVGKDEETPPAR